MLKSRKTIEKKHTKKSASKKVSKVDSKKVFRTYKQALSWLKSRTDYEKQKRLRYNVDTFNLDRMKKLLDFLGDPHTRVPCVHIAGTKGKGSTAVMLARMLEANGYKVGLYTSPHVTSLRERIAVNSERISQEQMLGLLRRIYKPVEEVGQEDSVTFFEIMTAMAFMHFVDVEADISVIEAGLGGRLDSTNLINPQVIGITSLSIDHQDQLGSDLESIAKEKAGVFKAGVPIISVPQKKEAMEVLKSRAKATNSSFNVTGKDIDFSYRFEASRTHGRHTRICLTTPSSKFEHIRVPLRGDHQAINCGLAMAMLDRLKVDGFEIDCEKAVQGLNNIQLAGRMEMICRDPRILIDAAHNAASVQALMHAIGQNIPYDSMVVIFTGSFYLIGEAKKRFHGKS